MGMAHRRSIVGVLREKKCEDFPLFQVANNKASSGDNPRNLRGNQKKNWVWLLSPSHDRLPKNRKQEHQGHQEFKDKHSVSERALDLQQRELFQVDHVNQVKIFC